MVSLPVLVARQAMATRFEIALHGANPVSLRAAGEEALSEIERIEGQLSLYRPSSEIARVNARAAHEPVRVSPPVFRLLEQAARLSAEMRGAFDITVGPLMKCWGFVGGGGRIPDPKSLAEALACVGMNLVALDASNFTVRFAREGVMLDLGAIGKGYAVGVAADTLREAGVSSALIHGGTSTAYAMGHAPDGEAWKIAIDQPDPGSSRRQEAQTDRTEEAREALPRAPKIQGLAAGRSFQPIQGDATRATPPLAVVSLRDEALSVSAVWGKSFQSGAKTFGHVLDPRTGDSAGNAILAAVVLPDATETDALSTALLTLGRDGLALLRGIRPSARALVSWDCDGLLQADGIGSILVPD